VIEVEVQGCDVVLKDKPETAFAPGYGHFTLVIASFWATEQMHGARFRHKFVFEDTIGAHACWFEANST
jgi:hypothetical protein